MSTAIKNQKIKLEKQQQAVDKNKPIVEIQQVEISVNEPIVEVQSVPIDSIKKAIESGGREYKSVMKCEICQSENTKITSTRRETGQISRYHRCGNCRWTWKSVEVL